MSEQVDLTLIIGILITMILSAFFLGMEVAFVPSNRMLAQMDKEKMSISKRFLPLFFSNPNSFVSIMLVGNNIVLVVYGISIARLFDQTIFSGMDAAFTVPADTVLSILIILSTGEFLPKILFQSNPNRLMQVFAFPTYLSYVILRPISRFATLLSGLILRLFRVRVLKDATSGGFSKIDLDYLIQSNIDNARGNEEIEDEMKIFHSVLDFPDTKVRDCMVPRTEVNSVDINTCILDGLRQRFTESGNSKIIVYTDDIDHIEGYTHSSELFKNPSSWKDGIRSMPFVPETMPAQKLMQIFLQQKKSLGTVVSEFGGTSDIISSEDIAEEIFGEIEDEHDSLKYVAKQTNEDEYLSSVRLEINKVNEMFSLGLPEGEEYMTLGGLVLNVYRSFPELNEIVKIGKFEFKVIKIATVKIGLVQLKVLPE